jgi:bla regulator protein blaR1
MNPFAIYLVKVTGAFALFYLCYLLFLKTDTFFNRNRFYLLGSLAIAVVLPLLKITVRTVYVQQTPQLSIPAFNIQDVASVKPDLFWPLVLKIILAVYFAGVLVFLFKLALAYLQVIRIISKSERANFYNLLLSITQQTVSPFSFFKWVVIPKTLVSTHDFNNIVQHESIHSRQLHSVDLFMAEIMVAFQWFNPFVWMTKSAIVENHEYIVDRQLLKSGVDARQYQYSLLNTTTAGIGQLAVVNHFNINLLKKRIRMMNRTKSSKWYGLKNAIILLAVSIALAFSATFETKVIAQSAGNEPLVIINGKKSDNNVLMSLNPKKIQRINVIKDSTATKKYGKDAKNGVVEVFVADTITLHLTGKMEDVHVTGYADSLSDKKIRASFAYGNVDPKDMNNKIESKVLIIMTDSTGMRYGNDGKNENVTFYKIERSENGVYTPCDNQNNIVIRSKPNQQEPLYIINGKIASPEEVHAVKPDEISSIEVLKDKSAKKIYGDKADNGVIMVNLKRKAMSRPEKTLAFVPNPASDNVEVSLGVNPSGTLTVKVYSKSGEIVYQDKKTGSPFTIPVSRFKAGVYIVVVTDGEDVYNGSVSVVH